MTRFDYLRHAEGDLKGAEENMAKLAAGINVDLRVGRAVPGETVAALATLQVQLAEAWIRLAREKAT